MGLRRKMAKGVFWLFLEKCAQQTTFFVVFAVIARLVGPEEYGLVALCTIFQSLSWNTISGLVDGIISLHIKDERRLSTLFWLVTLCGALLSLGLSFFAPLFAALMGEPRLASLLACFAALPILHGFMAIPTALITEKMDFRIFALRSFVATLAGGVVGIVLALRGYGAYALVLQQLTLYAVVNVILWPGCGWHPRLMFDWHGMREVMKLGLSQTSSSLLGVAEQNVPRLILGVTLGPAATGLYAFALRICSMVQDGFMQPILSLVHPSFAQITEDHAEKKKILAALLMLMGGALIPLVAGGIMTAPTFVPLLFGEKWAEAIPLLQILLITALTNPLIVVMRDLMRAHKKTAVFLKAQIVLTLIWLLAALGFAKAGLFVFMAGYAIATVLTLGIDAALLAHHARLSPWGDFMRFWTPAVAAIAMAAGIEFLERAAGPSLTGSSTLLAAQIALGAVIYVTLYGLLERTRLIAALKLLRKARG